MIKEKYIYVGDYDSIRFFAEVVDYDEEVKEVERIRIKHAREVFAKLLTNNK